MGDKVETPNQAQALDVQYADGPGGRIALHREAGYHGYAGAVCDGALYCFDRVELRSGGDALSIYAETPQCIVKGLLRP